MRVENEKVSEKLHALQIEQSETASSQGKQSLFSPELNELDLKVSENRKQADAAKHVAKKVHLVDD